MPLPEPGPRWVEGMYLVVLSTHYPLPSSDTSTPVLLWATSPLHGIHSESSVKGPTRFPLQGGDHVRAAQPVSYVPLESHTEGHTNGKA